MQTPISPGPLKSSNAPVILPAYNRSMDRLRRWVSAIWWRKDVAERGVAASPVARLSDSGIYVSILVGIFSVAVLLLGAWYISTEEFKRTEAAAFQDTANLSRAFEEHIIRLIQAHDQILIFA